MRKSLAIVLLSGLGLTGCVAVPMYGPEYGAPGYGPVYAPPATVVVRPYYGGYGYYGHYRGGRGYYY